MNHLQRKCVVASTTFHGLLVLLLLFGVAFKSPDLKHETRGQVITVIDTPAEGGGPGQSLQPETPPKPPATSMPSRVPSQSSLPLNPTSPTSEVEPPTARRPPQVNTRVISRPVRSTPAATETTTPSREEPSTDRARQFAAAINSVLGSVTPGSRVNIQSGAEGAQRKRGYEEIVKDAYTRGWVPPDGESLDEGTISSVTITIAHSGKILAARILKSSGKVTVDKSVEQVLARIVQLEPFEAGAKDAQRTYTINFKLTSHGLE